MSILVAPVERLAADVLEVLVQGKSRVTDHDHAPATDPTGDDDRLSVGGRHQNFRAGPFDRDRPRGVELHARLVVAHAVLFGIPVHGPHVPQRLRLVPAANVVGTGDGDT